MIDATAAFTTPPLSRGSRGSACAGAGRGAILLRRIRPYPRLLHGLLHETRHMLVVEPVAAHPRFARGMRRKTGLCASLSYVSSAWMGRELHRCPGRSRLTPAFNGRSRSDDPTWRGGSAHPHWRAGLGCDHGAWPWGRQIRIGEARVPIAPPAASCEFNWQLAYSTRIRRFALFLGCPVASSHCANSR